MQFHTTQQRALGLAAVALGLALTRRATRARHFYSFKGRTILITGGSRGLGFELARQLADEGAHLWLLARTDEDLERAASQLRKRGAIVDTITADVRKPEDVRRAVAEVVRGSNRLDVLINNAGIIEVSPFENATIEDFEDSLATHFWGPFALIRESLPHLQRSGQGRIVNISSIGGRVAVPHLSSYAAGKFALTGLSETLHAELKKFGVIVTTVSPGLMRTESYVNARIRGQHRREFRWFAAMSAAPVTAMNVSRAASQIIEACRSGRAAITPNWQARAAQAVAAIAPNAFAAMNANVDRFLLPRPTPDPSATQARMGAEIDPGPIKALHSAERARTLNQPQPAWS